MGATSLIDIIGSLVIGGLLLVTALTMNNNATQNTYQAQENLTVQQNMISLVNTITSDFRKIGFCADPSLVPTSDSMVVSGNANGIKFLANMYPEVDNSYNSVDTVYWYWDIATKLYTDTEAG